MSESERNSRSACTAMAFERTHVRFRAHSQGVLRVTEQTKASVAVRTATMKQAAVATGMVMITITSNNNNNNLLLLLLH